MLKIFVFVTVTIAISPWCGVIQCAPQSEYYRVQETIDEQNIVQDDPVKYDGAQLWNIPFEDETTRNTIIGLQDDFG